MSKFGTLGMRSRDSTRSLTRALTQLPASLCERVTTS